MRTFIITRTPTLVTAIAVLAAFVLAASFVWSPPALAGGASEAEQKLLAALSPEELANTIVLQLKHGRVIIRLRPDKAPKHVERVKQLIADGFYNGHTFHRVIDGFMAQTGDPTGTGMGGSSYPDLAAEFNDLPFKRGTIGAARTMDPNSANSQFFICFADTDHLNGKYTVWGQVASGMEYVDMIAKGEPPATPDTIEKMYMASEDLKK
ncbi:MAG: peptidylprolyl isomerase [Hyphomicrobium sp.]|uniref:peptidylprolyl isomerase n=1 Tax=Hyphomicrobium sp. TaxID=82 RepID=UPI003D0A4866